VELHHEEQLAATYPEGEFLISAGNGNNLLNRTGSILLPVSHLLYQSTALAVAFNFYLTVELLHTLPLLEFIGVGELKEIRGIKADNTS
jgi:hypothetical protein